MPEKRRILLVDDEPDWLRTIERILGNDDYQFSSFEDPTEAIRSLKSNYYSLVILDKNFPGSSGTTSGLDVLSEMRRIIPDLRAIILTGHPSVDSVVDGFHRGALDYIRKGSRDLKQRLKDSVGRLVNMDLGPLKVFISYARKDREQVVKIYDKLTADGFIPWIDFKSILKGKKWEPEIKKAIKKADIFLPCLSPNTLRREGMLQQEYRWALNKQEGLLDDTIYIVPLRLSDCEIPEALQEFQCVDYFFSKTGYSDLIKSLRAKSESRSNGGHN